jgi:hypothetical protein
MKHTIRVIQKDPHKPAMWRVSIDHLMVGSGDKAACEALADELRADGAKVSALYEAAQKRLAERRPTNSR